MYTFTPKQPHAKAFGRNLRISAKKAMIICRVITKKKLKVAKRLLEDLVARKRDLEGKYYTKTVNEIYELLKSCESNAKALGLDETRLFVHAAANKGVMIRRPRRKAGFGSRLKTTNVELMLIESGKEKSAKEK